MYPMSRFQNMLPRRIKRYRGRACLKRLEEVTSRGGAPGTRLVQGLGRKVSGQLAVWLPWA